jgi:hypothetical protein
MTFRGLSEGKRVARRLMKIIKRKRQWEFSFFPESMKEWEERTKRYYRKTKVPCSCWMCTWYKTEKTKQEKIADIRENEQMREILY